MLTHDEELWEKELPPAVEELLSSAKDPLADRSDRCESLMSTLTYLYMAAMHTYVSAHGCLNSHTPTHSPSLSPSLSSLSLSSLPQLARVLH